MESLFTYEVWLYVNCEICRKVACLPVAVQKWWLSFGAFVTESCAGLEYVSDE